MQILRHSKIAITMEICTEVVSSATPASEKAGFHDRNRPLTCEPRYGIEP